MSSLIAVQDNLAAFNATLRRYLFLTQKSPDEVLERKGKDIGIKLFQGFYAKRWKGSRTGKGVAWKELKARSKEGEGIKLRPGIQADPAAPQTYMAYRKIRGAFGSVRKLLVPMKTSEYQKKVFAELRMRQSGIGVLGASFLWTRKLSNQERGTFYVRNKTGKALGSASHTPGEFEIIGDVAGQHDVSERYGVEAQALSNAREDMVKYFNEKHLENYKAAFGEAPK